MYEGGRYFVICVGIFWLMIIWCGIFRVISSVYYRCYNVVMDMNEGIGEITGLKATQRDADRVGVYVDGKYLLALNMADVARLGLCVGMKWEGGIAEEAEVAKGYGKAYKQAVNRLGRRMMSEGMMRDKLRALKHEDVVIDAVIDKLLELGLLDDLKFGRALVHHSHLGKPTGPAMVKSRLWGKGLKAGLIDQLIGEMKEEEGYDQLEMAKRLIRSRLRG